MQEIRLELDLYTLTDKAQSWLGFLDDETKPGRRGRRRDGTVDSTNGDDK